MTNPLVSVIMPVRNGGAYLAPAVDSVLAQTFADFELIIINDGSTDDSREIIEDYARADSRIRAFSQAGQGLVPALNRGLAKAKGRYLARMDSDDICLPYRFATQVKELEARPELGVVGSAVLIMDSRGEVTGQQTYPRSRALRERLLHGDLLCHPAIMGRTELFRQAGGYRAYYRHCEDYDLWLRLSVLAELDNLAEPLLLYRVHEHSVTRRHAGPQMLGMLIAQSAHLIARRTGRDITAELAPVSAETLETLPLSDEERKGLYLRLLPMYFQACAVPARDAFARRSLAWLTPRLGESDAAALRYLQRAMEKPGA